MTYRYKGFDIESEMHSQNRIRGINVSKYYKCSTSYTNASGRKFYIDDFKLKIGYDIQNDSKKALEEGIRKRVDYMYNQYLSSVSLVNTMFANREYEATPIMDSQTHIDIDRWKEIAESSLDWFAEHFDEGELHDILTTRLGMTEDEISNSGFDLSDNQDQTKEQKISKRKDNMSTRSLIAKQIGDDKFRTIYCHMDGYLTHNGALLVDHYDTPEKVDEILALGDLSFLTPQLYPDPNKPHSFDYNNRQDGVTVAYGRDRGETDIEAQDLTMKELIDTQTWANYCYVFTDDNRWKYFQYGKDDYELKDVESAVAKEYENYGINERPAEYYGFLTDSIAEEMKHVEAEDEIEIQPTE